MVKEIEVIKGSFETISRSKALLIERDLRKKVLIQIPSKWMLVYFTRIV